MPSARGVKVELIRDLGALDRVALGRAAQPGLFDRHDWFARTWRYCAAGTRPVVAHARIGSAQAWLMLTRDGRRVRGLASWYTLCFRPVFLDASTGERDVLLAAIARRLRGTAGHVVLDTVPAEAADALARGFATAGWHVHRMPHVAHWTVAVAGQSFADYWAARPGQLRSTVRRKSAKGGVCLTVLTAFDDASWSAFEDVYADSWKPGEGSRDFLRDMARVEGAAGCLRIGIARVDDRVVAAQLWTVENGVAIIHKLAHRRDAVALSPGTLLTRAMFEHAIDRDRVTSIDFGTGDDAYKADWMTSRALLECVELFDMRRPAGLAAFALDRLASLVARLRRR